MTRKAREATLVGLALALAAGTPATAQDLQQKLAAAKQNAAANQQALRSYGWIEKVELSLKGEVKNTTVNSCRYGADGKVQKTAVVEPPPAEKKRGLRGKVIEKKNGRDEGGARGGHRPRSPVRAAGPGDDAEARAVRGWTERARPPSRRASREDSIQ